MRINRFFHRSPLKPEQTVDLDKDVSAHIHRVLRLKESQEIELFNGDGQNYQASILNSGKTVTVKILRQSPADNESALKIHLGQAISRGERMDFTLQKAVELGVNEITPIISERVQFRMNEKRMEKKIKHWQKIIESACEQSGRAYVPTLHSAKTLDNWLTEGSSSGFLFVPKAKMTLMEIGKQTSIRLLVGPEGGLSDQEVDLALNNPAFSAVNLGPRILRTETAALAAISILQAQSGDI